MGGINDPLVGFRVSTLLLLPLARQLQPYCNVVTLAVTQNGGVYRVEGTDDHCGTAQAPSVIGTAFRILTDRWASV